MGIEALLSRTVADIRSGGTLAVAMETRNIVVAQGIQFTNADNAAYPYCVLPKGLNEPLATRVDWPASLKTRPPLPIVTTATGFEYTDIVQGVKFVVYIITTKAAFRNALLTPNVHLVYDGHARYGRGPCFGILPVPGQVSTTEYWEDGTNPTTTGWRHPHMVLTVRAWTTLLASATSIDVEDYADSHPDPGQAATPQRSGLAPKR